MSTAALAHSSGSQYRFEHSAEWHTVSEFAGITLGGGWTDVVLANFPLEGCGAPADLNCLFRIPVPEGGVFVHVGGASGLMSIFDPSREWSTTIDGMPAQSMSGPGYVGVDELRRWSIAMPGTIDTTVVVSATVRGPGVQRLDAQVDALARSIRFDHHLAPLDPLTAGAVLEKVVDELDRREQRDSKVAFYACFPRSAGEQRVTITTWFATILAAPTDVTCSSAIEATDVSLWRVRLSVRWDAGVEYPAGEWRLAEYADTDGALVGEEVSIDNAAPLAGFGQR